MALKRFLKRAVQKATVKAAKSKAAKTAASRVNKAAKSTKASQLRISSQNATAKAKLAAKEAAAKKVKPTAPKVQSNTKTPAQREKAYRENKNTPTNKDKKVTAAAESRAKSKLEASRKTKNSPSTIKTTVKTTGRIKATPAKKVPVKSKSQTRIANRRSQRATAKKYGERTRKEAYVDFDGGNDTVKARKIARTPGLKKKSDSRVKAKTTTKTPTKAEKARTRSNNLNDHGAAHVRANTPKSTRATAKAAGGSVRHAHKKKTTSLRTAQDDFFAGQRDGVVSGKKGVTNGKDKRLKGDSRLNPRQTPEGKITRRAEEAQKRGSKAFNKAKRELKMKETLKKTRKDLSGVERQKLQRQLSKNLTAQEQRAGKKARGKSVRRDVADKMNQSPSQAYQREKDMRNSRSRRRTSVTEQRRAQRLSEHMTKIKASGGYKPLKKVKTGVPKASTAGGKAKPTTDSRTRTSTRGQLAGQRAVQRPTANSRSSMSVRRQNEPLNSRSIRTRASAIQEARTRNGTLMSAPKPKNKPRVGGVAKSSPSTTSKAVRPKTASKPKGQTRAQTQSVRATKAQTAQQRAAQTKATNDALPKNLRTREPRLQGTSRGSKYSSGVGSEGKNSAGRIGANDGTKARNVDGKALKKAKGQDNRSVGSQKQAQQTLAGVEADRKERLARVKAKRARQTPTQHNQEQFDRFNGRPN